MKRGLYFFSRAFSGMRRCGFLHFVTVGTITVCLLVLGILLIVFVNVNHVFEKWKDELQVTMYLDDTVSVENKKEIMAKLEGMKEVKYVRYVSKEDALLILKESLQTDDSSFEALSKNPLPSSFEIQLNKEFLDLNKLESFVDIISRFEGIEDIQYDEKWIRGFSAFLQFYSITGLTIGGVLLLAVFLIVSNTIRLSVYARRNELDILCLVGATRLFIKIPFFIEGLIFGLLGGFFSIVLLFALYQMFIAKVSLPLGLYLGDLKPSFLPADFILGIVFGGMFLGILSNMFSLEKILRVQKA